MPSRTLKYAMLGLLCVFPRFNSIAHGQDKLSGLYQVVITSKDAKSIPDQKTILAFNQLDDKLFAVDLHRPTTLLVGFRRGKNVELPLDVITAWGGGNDTVDDDGYLQPTRTAEEELFGVVHGRGSLLRLSP